MRNGMAETIAEAEAQEIQIPQKFDDREWRQFAGLIDGYKIAKEMGIDFHRWGYERQQKYEQTGRWDLNLLELRVMLFYQYRADYMSGWTYHERDHLVDSLLQVLSDTTGQPYTPYKPE
jgi:hypothetical protein